MSYKIGELAERAGMTVEGLRFYERRGLLRPARKTAAGYRIYGEAELEQLLFVRAAQRMGFSLTEIQELLELRTGCGVCSEVRDRLRDKLETVREKQRLLEAFARQLDQAIDRCGEQLRSGPDETCPVLADLGAGLDPGGTGR